MCVFNFFFRKSWLAGEGDHLLQKKKLKMEFCGCSDTRRAFSRACIAKSAYHKPSLSRRMGAALPLRPCAHVVPPRGAEQQQRTQLDCARAHRRGSRSSALRAGAGARQTDCGESERAVSGQCVWRGAQRPTRRPRSACLCPALLRENNQQQTEIGAY